MLAAAATVTAVPARVEQWWQIRALSAAGVSFLGGVTVPQQRRVQRHGAGVMGAAARNPDKPNRTPYGEIRAAWLATPITGGTRYLYRLQTASSAAVRGREPPPCCVAASTTKGLTNWLDYIRRRNRRYDVA